MSRALINLQRCSHQSSLMIRQSAQSSLSPFLLGPSRRPPHPHHHPLLLLITHRRLPRSRRACGRRIDPARVCSGFGAPLCAAHVRRRRPAPTPSTTSSSPPPNLMETPTPIHGLLACGGPRERIAHHLHRQHRRVGLHRYILSNTQEVRAQGYGGAVCRAAAHTHPVAHNLTPLARHFAERSSTSGSCSDCECEQSCTRLIPPTL